MLTDFTCIYAIQCASRVTVRLYNSYRVYPKMKSKKSKQKQHKDKILNEIPIFLAQTYRIVDNPEHADVIEWIPEENGFIIKNISELTEKIFPKYFKHTKYASFVRQLNLYGFHKVRSNDDGHIFTHNYFLKNNPDLLPLMKRKNATGTEDGRLEKSSELALIAPVPQSLALMPNPDANNNNQLEKELGSLTQKHESLQNLVSVLVQQNKQIILQNKSFINKINTLDDSYRKKLETLIFLMVFGLKNGDSSIIVPQQLNNMIKAFTSGKKQKKSKTNMNGNAGADNPSQAMELFKKPTQDESRFNNKKIQEILQMLKMESEGSGGEASDLDQLKDQEERNQLAAAPDQLQKKSSIQNNQQSFMNDLQHPPSPIASLRSLSSRYMNDHRLHEDWNDFLDKLEHSDIDLDPHRGEESSVVINAGGEGDGSVSK